MRDIMALAKPRLSMLVLCTTAVGLWIAPTSLSLTRALITMAATACMVAAANSLNCFIERDIDGLMHRTRERPLPSGRLDPRIALYLGLGLAVVASFVLAIAANLITAILGLTAFVTYVAIYTPMKLKTPWAVVVGAVPGAIPPLMGWTAATGHIEAGGLALFALLFAWQLPHFIAIATYLSADYARAALQVLPVAHDERTTKAWMLVSVLALIPTSLLPYLTGIAGYPYVVAAILTGGAFMGAAVYGIWAVDTCKWARRIFVGSLVYLTVLLAVLVVGAH